MRFNTPIHRWVYYVLLAGLSLSVLLLVVGSAASLLFSGALPKQTLAPAMALRSALAGEGQGLVSLGLLGLLATPLAVVLASFFVSAVQRDLVGALASLGVALVMVVSFLLGKG